MSFMKLLKWCGRRLRSSHWHQKTRLAGVFALLALATPSSWAADPEVMQLARAVDQHYNDLGSLQAEFTEVYRGAGIERSESGTLWLKKPGKMRWEYRSPREKLFLSDGRTAWLYVQGDRQARKTAASKLNDVRSPLALLLGKLKLEKELQGLSLAPDRAPLTEGDVVLRGVPRGTSDRVSGVLVEIAGGHRIARIVIEEADGATTDFRFDGQRENQDMPESRFRFQAPAGVEVVDGGFNP